MTVIDIFRFLGFLGVQRMVVGDLFVLRNESHIYCPSLEATPYLRPPTINEVTNFVDLPGTWSDSDWNDSKSTRKNTTSLIGPVLDPRWRHFPFRQSKTITLQIHREMSLSILAPFEATFFIQRNHKNTEKVEISKSSNEMIHYTFFFEDHFLNLYENEKRIGPWNVSHKNDSTVVIRSDKDIYYKLHKYEYKSAKTVTKGKPTTLILNNEASCLTVYTILCPTCYLEVSYNDNLALNITSENNSTMRKWDSHPLKAEFKKNGTISFYRGKTDNNINGFWGLATTSCPSDFALYIVNGSTKNYTCHGLNESRIQNATGNDGFCEEPGKLGRNCEESCSKILGPNYPYCENHTMCTEKECVCSWGYSGNDCNEGCKKGTWGLRCQYNCNKCKICDKKTGKCLENVPAQMQTALIIIITVIFVLCPPTIYILYKKLNMCGRYSRVNPIQNVE